MPFGNTIRSCLGELVVFIHKMWSSSLLNKISIAVVWDSLIKALKSNPTPQLQYWIIVCFWELSYEDEVAKGADK